MDSCCPLGAISLDRDQVLHQTDNFFVAPTIGPIGREGYVLILSKDHELGMGDVSSDQHHKLEQLLKDTRRVLEEVYGTVPLVFEHGPRVGAHRGGGCLDHAHFHVVPGVDVTRDFATDMISRLEQEGLFYRVDRVAGFRRLQDILGERRSSYLFVDNPAGMRYVAEVNFPLPSQYIRRLIANQQGTDEWNWRLHPQKNIFQETIDRLTGKF